MQRILIAGFGSIARRHLRNIRTILPHATITVWRQHTPVDPNTPTPEGADAIVGSLADAVASRPEVVIVAGPATTHTETAITFAKLGAHLFVEKPIADRLDGINELIDVCRQNNLTLMVGYILRFLPALRTIRDLLNNGAIGDVLSARIEVGQYLPDWRPTSDYKYSVTAQQKLGGGAILELSHELDYARWLLGEPSSVTCLARQVSTLDIDVEDVAEVLLSFQAEPGGYRRRGPIASVHVDLLQRDARMSCQLIGSQGTINSNLITEEVQLFTVESETWSEVKFTKSQDGNEPYLRQFEHFLECIKTGQMPPASGVDGKRVLEIALAAKQSAETGQLQQLSPLAKSRSAA